MATIYLAIDEVDGLTLPLGQIKGLSDSEASLRTAGFDATTYTGNRLSTVDDQAAGWDNDVEPGWYLTATNTVADTLPSTDLADLRQAIRDFQAQVLQWYAAVNALAVGQPADRVADGRRRLYEALGAVYLFSTNTANSLADRKLFASNMRFGAADITKADDFYASTVSVLGGDDPDRTGAVDWHCWVDPTNPGGPRRNLANSAVVNGMVGGATNLLGDYASTIVS